METFHQQVSFLSTLENDKFLMQKHTSNMHSIFFYTFVCLSYRMQSNVKQRQSSTPSIYYATGKTK